MAPDKHTSINPNQSGCNVDKKSLVKCNSQNQKKCKTTSTCPSQKKSVERIKIRLSIQSRNFSATKINNINKNWDGKHCAVGDKYSNGMKQEQLDCALDQYLKEK